MVVGVLEDLAIYTCVKVLVANDFVSVSSFVQFCSFVWNSKMYVTMVQFLNIALLSFNWYHKYKYKTIIQDL